MRCEAGEQKGKQEGTKGKSTVLKEALSPILSSELEKSHVLCLLLLTKLGQNSEEQQKFDLLALRTRNKLPLTSI